MTENHEYRIANRREGGHTYDCPCDRCSWPERIGVNRDTGYDPEEEQRRANMRDTWTVIALGMGAAVIACITIKAIGLLWGIQ